MNVSPKVLAEIKKTSKFYFLSTPGWCLFPFSRWPGRVSAIPEISGDVLILSQHQRLICRSSPIQQCAWYVMLIPKATFFPFTWSRILSNLLTEPRDAGRCMFFDEQNPAVCVKVFKIWYGFCYAFICVGMLVKTWKECMMMKAKACSLTVLCKLAIVVWFYPRLHLHTILHQLGCSAVANPCDKIICASPQTCKCQVFVCDCFQSCIWR